MIIDEPYTVNEKYGVKWYEVCVASPDWNSPIIWYSDRCKVTKTKKIEKLRRNAIEYARKHKEADERQWQQVSTEK